MKIHKRPGQANHFTIKVPKIVENAPCRIEAGDVIEVEYMKDFMKVMFVFDQKDYWLCLCERWSPYEIWR